MKKRLLTAWLIACMMISLVGQTPITALAEGDDSRVIPMSDGLKEVLILDDASETPEAQGETTAVEIPETQTEQDENATIANPDTDTQITQDENTTEKAPDAQIEQSDNQTVQPDDAIVETPDVQNEQDENVIADDNQNVQTEDTTAETPDAQIEKNDSVEETPDALAEQNESSEETSENQEDKDAYDSQIIKEENPIDETPAANDEQGEDVIVETPECIEKTVDAELPEGTLNYGDIVRVSGLLPVDAIVEAIPVNVEIEGQSVLLAYDITIYENEEKKNAGISWQPDENGLSVEFISIALEQTEEEVNIWHMEDATETPEYVTAAPSPEGSVEFVAESFSVYVVSATKLTSTIVASDGNTYEINVTYTNLSGIPMDGTKLAVSELKTGDAGYDEYIEESASKVGTKAENFEFSKVFDIKIVDENDEAIEYEPTGDVDVSIRVIGVSLSEYPQVNVLHFVEDRNDENFLVYDVNSNVNGETVEFTTNGFSVYVIVGHEGSDIETPRMTIHFLAPVTDTATQESYDSVNGVYNYTVGSFSFLNKAGTWQTTQIVQDGETLERISNPPNFQGKFFFGWYVVNVSAKTDSSYTFRWTAAPKNLQFDTPVGVVDNGDGTFTMSWSVNGELFTETADVDDTDYSAHIYVAPIYEDYCFVNFHELAYAVSNSSNLLTRKLVILGDDGVENVLISDVSAPATDTIRRIFRGWQYRTNDTWISVQTMDNSANVIRKTIDVTGDTDLYPYFQEGRWIYYNVGESGNGAKYVPAQFTLAEFNTQDGGASVGGNITSLPTTNRVGYDFGGWRVIVNNDTDNPQYALISDADGNILSSFTYTDKDGNTIAPPAGCSSTSVSVNEDYEDNDGNILNGVAFTVQNGVLTIKYPLSYLTLYALWTEKANATVTIIIWKQKVTDSPDATDAQKTYDYYALPESILPSVVNKNSGLQLNQLGLGAYEGLVTNNDTKNDFVGFVYSRSEMNTPKVRGDGSTVVNVYYDRITYDLKFIFARRNSTNNNANIYVPTLTGSFNPPANITWQSYCTGGSGMRWDDSNTNELTQVCSYPSSTIQSEVYSGNRYYFYVIRANYGQDISAFWPQYSYFPNNSRYLSGWWMMSSAGLYGSAGQNDTVKGVVSTMDESILGNVGDGNANFLIASYRTNTPKDWTYNIYLETLSGVDYSGKTTVSRNGKIYYLEDSFIARSSNENVSQQNTPAYTGFNTGEQVNCAYPTMNFYYTRQDYTLTFDYNYPVETGLGDKRVSPPDKVYYQASLSGYDYVTNPSDLVNAIRPSESEIPDHYIFRGWYEDAKGTTPFDFSGTMPAADKIAYGKWEPVYYNVLVDPNGGVINHINYSESTEDDWPTFYLDGFTSANSSDSKWIAAWNANGDTVGSMPSWAVTLRTLGNGHNVSQSTYFSAQYGTAIGEYDLERKYVEYDGTDDGTKLYYVNMQFNSTSGEWGLHSDMRNALYLTASQLEAYYKYCKAAQAWHEASRPGYYDGTIPATFDEFKDLYVKKKGNGDYALYESVNSSSYAFVGWYVVNDNGTVSDNPYSFANAVEGPISLRAIWRKIGSFYLSYDPAYILDDNGNTVIINGVITAWTDPADVNTEKYNDGATTTTLQQPTGITVNGVDAGDDYIFRGWQVVKITGYDTNGYAQYTALHPGVYYPEPTVFVIDASDADSNGCIHMQAVYQPVNVSDLRPEVANLMLNANDGYLTSNGGNTALTSNANITAESGWKGIGTVVEDAAENEVVFGDMQSNDAVHLYKYAIRQGALDPPYDNSGLYFKHPNNYLLIGFDEKPDYTHKITQGDSSDNTDSAYVPHYASDAVISVQRTDSEKLYAVWEPMVYVTFKNRTSQPVTFTVSGEEAMKVVNEVTGLFSREKFTETTITLAVGESIKLVMPEGADKGITINGTNTNTAQLLTISSYHHQEDESHKTGSTTAGAFRSSGADYNLSDMLFEDEVGVLVFFDGTDTVFYDVNGGAWTDTSRTGSDRNTVLNNSSLLFVDEDGMPYAPVTLPDEAPEPTVPTRTGYKFVGWTADYDAAHCDLAEYTLPGTDETAGINNMAVVKNSLLWDFSNEATEGMTLYAVWGELLTVTFHITNNHTWKETDTAYFVPGNNRTWTVTLAKGDIVNTPNAPTWNAEHTFYRWVGVAGQNITAYQGGNTNVADIDTNHIFNFGKPVLNSIDLYTSWIEARYINVDISKVVDSVINEDKTKDFNFNAVITTSSYTLTVTRSSSGSWWSTSTNWAQSVSGPSYTTETQTFTLKDGDDYILPLYFLSTAQTPAINSNGTHTATVFYQSVVITEVSDPNFKVTISVDGNTSNEATVTTLGTAPTNAQNNTYGYTYTNGNDRTYTLHSVPKYNGNTNPAAEVPVVFTNTRDMTDVKVTKIVTPDDYLTGDETFNFTATYKDSSNQTVTPPALTGYDAYGYAANGNTASFTLKDGQEFILRGVPIDGSVTVTETAIGWTATSVNDNDSNDTDGATFTLNNVPVLDGGITFTNARDTYDVTVTNKVAPKPYGDETKPFTYTATLWDGDTQVVFPSTITDVTFTNGRKNMTFTLKHEQEYIIRNLPGGYKLVVTQTEDADYEIESTGKQIANNIAITDGDTANDNIFIISAIGVDAQIDFVNTLKKGQYTITKHIQLEVGQTMPENKTFVFTARLLKSAGSQNPEEINTELKAAVEAAGATVTDTDADGKYDAILFSFTHGGAVDLTSVDGAEITLPGLPVGHFLQVTETAPGYAAYINNIRTESTTVQIAEGDNGNINYINRPASSILKIQKTDALDSSPIQGAKFRLYSVKGGNQNTLFTLTSDNDGWLTYTESGNVNNVLSLENGTYYMVETDAPNGYRKSADVITIVVNNSETDPQDRIKLGTGSVGTLTWTSETEPFILTVTNERVDIAPTNYSNKFLPFALIFMVSLLLCSTPIIAKMKKREEEN